LGGARDPLNAGIKLTVRQVGNSNHQMLLAAFGGATGLRDKNLLDSAQHGGG